MDEFSSILIEVVLEFDKSIGIDGTVCSTLLLLLFVVVVVVAVDDVELVALVRS